MQEQYTNVDFATIKSALNDRHCDEYNCAISSDTQTRARTHVRVEINGEFYFNKLKIYSNIKCSRAFRITLGQHDLYNYDAEMVHLLNIIDRAIDILYPTYENLILHTHGTVEFDEAFADSREELPKTIVHRHFVKSHITRVGNRYSFDSVDKPMFFDTIIIPARVSSVTLYVWANNQYICANANISYCADLTIVHMEALNGFGNGSRKKIEFALGQLTDEYHPAIRQFGGEPVADSLSIIYQRHNILAYEGAFTYLKFA